MEVLQRLIVFTAPPFFLMAYTMNMGGFRAVWSTFRSANSEIHALYGCAMLFILAYAFSVLDRNVTLIRDLRLLEDINKGLSSAVPKEGPGQADREAV